MHGPRPSPSPLQPRGSQSHGLSPPSDPLPSPSQLISTVQPISLPLWAVDLAPLLSLLRQAFLSKSVQHVTDNLPVCAQSHALRKSRLDIVPFPPHLSSNPP
ncbi:hypothetical protein ACLOJK_032823 [Asimina triloba]